VVRVFDPSVAGSIEQRYGLSAGDLIGSAMSVVRLRPAILGDESHEAWLESIAMDLADRAGGLDRAQDAVREWAAYRGQVVIEVLDVIRQLRARGVPVGLVTNSTTRLDADLAELGLVGQFDAVVNSSAIGAHKPTGGFFRAACAAVGVAPSRCLFVDDDDRCVRGARAAGLSAFRFTSTADLAYLQAALAHDERR
jgi:putative hydrolase of the HAD superfamily